MSSNDNKGSDDRVDDDTSKSSGVPIEELPKLSVRRRAIRVGSPSPIAILFQEDRSGFKSGGERTCFRKMSLWTVQSSTWMFDSGVFNIIVIVMEEAAAVAVASESSKKKCGLYCGVSFYAALLPRVVEETKGIIQQCSRRPLSH